MPASRHIFGSVPSFGLFVLEDGSPPIALMSVAVASQVAAASRRRGFGFGINLCNLPSNTDLDADADLDLDLVTSSYKFSSFAEREQSRAGGTRWDEMPVVNRRATLNRSLEPRTMPPSQT